MVEGAAPPYPGLPPKFRPSIALMLPPRKPHGGMGALGPSANSPARGSGWGVFGGAVSALGGLETLLQLEKQPLGRHNPTMKLDTLASIAHDIADSLGSGESLVFNLWGIDVYRDADTSDGGVLEIDLVRGQVTSGVATGEVAEALKHAPQILASFCAGHGGMSPPPKAIKIKFFVERSPLGVLRRFSIFVEDHQGRQRDQEFYGSPGRKLLKGKQIPATAWSRA